MLTHSRIKKATLLAMIVALAVLGMACGGEEQTTAVEAPAEKTSGPAEEAAVAVTDPPALPTATEFERAYDKPEDVPEELRVIWEAWDILSQEYVDTSKLESGAIVAGAVRGMLSVLDDPQTAYVEPSTMQSSFGDMFRGDFEGIGAHVQINAAGKIVIVSPIEGSPAEAVGIRPGDIILEVDGESIEGWGLLDVVSLIRGPKGTKVTLLIKHLLALDPIEVTITRGVIELSSVLLRSEPGEKFAHVRITEFYPNTVDQLREILQQVQRDGAEGLILDLRNNPGGPLQSVVDVASQFLDDGLVLYVQRGDGRRTDWSVRQGGAALEIPMVMLVNDGSASASEVLAGALQDHGRATVIGATTFGKGSVNTLRELSNGAGLYLTTAYWYTPTGRLINHEGIPPDIEVVDRDPEEADVKQLRRAKEELEKIVTEKNGAIEDLEKMVADENAA